MKLASEPMWNGIYLKRILFLFDIFDRCMYMSKERSDDGGNPQNYYC